MLLSDVCLTSVAYIPPNSRTERPRKTKLGREVAHVTDDSNTTFKVKKSEVKVTRPLYSSRVNAPGSCSGERRNVLSMGTYCYVAVQAWSVRRREVFRRPQREERGGDILRRLPAYSSLIIYH